MPAAGEKTTLLELNISVEIRNTIQKAAEIKGLSLEDYVIEAARLDARDILEGDGQIRLNQEGSEPLLELLENPPKPNAALLRAKAVHRKLTGVLNWSCSFLPDGDSRTSV